VIENATKPSLEPFPHATHHPAFTFGRIVVDWMIETNGTPPP
jgi:hypothetical protein